MQLKSDERSIFSGLSLQSPASRFHERQCQPDNVVPDTYTMQQFVESQFRKSNNQPSRAWVRFSVFGLQKAGSYDNFSMLQVPFKLPDSDTIEFIPVQGRDCLWVDGNASRTR